MYPILFTVPGINFTLYTFAAFVLLGAISGLSWVRHEANRRGMDGEQVYSLAVEVFLAGLIGTRILFIINTPEAFDGKSFLAYLNLREGGLVWYGGPIAALPVAIWRMGVYKLKHLPVFDTFGQALVLAHGIGRIGWSDFS